MSKDPAFLFYPGDYLRDTQCLSEKAQVAYDRIMCEHMRNICISQAQLNFFTKRLTDEEKSELLFLLTEVDGGFMIEWVADSIVKRKAYSESRRNNRTSKKKERPKNISSTYDKHMENEIENEDVIENKDRIEGVEEREGIIYPWDSKVFKTNWLAWRTLLRDKHDKDYFNLTAEQSGLMSLNKLAKTETEAIEILQQSLRNGWKDLFKLKTENGKQITKDADQRNRDREAELAHLMAEKFGTPNH